MYSLGAGGSGGSVKPTPNREIVLTMLFTVMSRTGPSPVQPMRIANAP